MAKNGMLSDDIRSKHERTQCTANIHKKEGVEQRQCRNRAQPGRTTCKWHGGNTPAGIDSVHYKHGKYSRHLPTNVRKRYLAAIEDPDLLSLKNDIAVTESRILELMEKIDTGEAGKTWSIINKALDRLEKAILSGNQLRYQSAMKNVKDIAAQGMDDYKTYNDIKDMQEHRRKMTETENKMLIAKNQMITAQEFYTIIGLIREVIHHHVVSEIQDKQVRKAFLAGVSKDFNRLSVLEAV